MKHRNISIFIPHLGCPHCCAFCNQHSISGEAREDGVPSEAEVLEAVHTAAQASADYTELAFFGGSFTAIDRAYMLKLLAVAKACIASGMVDGIRISTRPDYINAEILEILKAHGVTAIELGAQSMIPSVLELANRGHTAEDVVQASKLIREYGFSLGLQMMVDLPGDTPEGAAQTAQQLAALKPDTVRIYPAITLKGTQMAAMYYGGEYLPMGLDKCVSLCAQLLLYFEDKGIRVIKLGLQDEPSLRKAYIAGAFHPAFRELCEGEIYYSSALHELEAIGSKATLCTIELARGETSKMIGQNRRNLERLASLGYRIKVVESRELKVREIRIKP
ncbi:MAG: radical SAM protein [Oscillospiraceae bacterium]|jgi:histone acetyltransferase (RNA polymerase elongator complex component)|nr:radical SAM protein [Oscillospiraceae bacterium]